jgi:transcriptional regulator with XRE-family HTH domain
MGLELRLERIKRGWTQDDLGLRSGVPQYRISLIERGLTPNSDEAQRLCAALGLNEIEKVFRRVKHGTISAHERQGGR